MGVLDDAIREHLELKRKHGAAEDEVKRQQEEALGPARRDVAHQHEDEADPAVAEQDAALFDGEGAPTPAAAESDAAAEAERLRCTSRRDEPTAPHEPIADDGLHEPAWTSRRSSLLRWSRLRWSRMCPRSRRSRPWRASLRSGRSRTSAPTRPRRPGRRHRSSPTPSRKRPPRSRSSQT